MTGLPALLLRPVRGFAQAWRTTRRSVALVPEVLEAVLVLPRLHDRLTVVGIQTATLIDMQAEIERMRGDTASLPAINQNLERVAVLLESVDANTTAVDQLAQVMLPLQGAATRVGRMADRWPPRGGRAASSNMGKSGAG